MTSAIDSNDPIFSQLGADPDMGELVEMFVGDLPDRIGTLQQAFQSGDVDTLKTIAHQLKGASGSYGFDQLSEKAATLEAAAQDGKSSDEIREALNEFVSVCNRARAGAPN